MRASSPLALRSSMLGWAILRTTIRLTSPFEASWAARISPGAAPFTMPGRRQRAETRRHPHGFHGPILRRGGGARITLKE